VAVVCLLLASSAQEEGGFGVLVTISVVATLLFMTYAFTLVWCYFAA
jgi:hypothetical protein